MSTPEQVPVAQSKPVVILGSVAAGGAALMTVLGSSNAPGWVKVSVAAVTAVALAVGGFLTTRVVTPWKLVGSKLDEATGQQVAGPAAPGSIVVGEVVDVTSAEPSPYSAPMGQAHDPFSDVDQPDNSV